MAMYLKPSIAVRRPIDSNDHIHNAPRSTPTGHCDKLGHAFTLPLRLKARRQGCGWDVRDRDRKHLSQRATACDG